MSQPPKQNGLNTLRFSLSPLTIAEHINDIETLGQLLVHKLFLDDHINALKQTIMATDAKHNAPVINGNNEQECYDT